MTRDRSNCPGGEDVGSWKRRQEPYRVPHNAHRSSASPTETLQLLLQKFILMCSRYNCLHHCACFVPPMKSNSSPRLAAEVPRSSVVSQSTVNNCNNCATIVSMIPTTTMAPLQSHSPVQGWVLSEAKSKASNIAQLGYPRYPDPFQEIGFKNPQLRVLGAKT